MEPSETREEVQGVKLRVDEIRKAGVWTIACLTLTASVVFAVVCYFFVPPFILSNSGLSTCPDNLISGRTDPFCRDFNIAINTYWYAYTHRFSPIERFLLLKLTAVPLANASKTVNLQYAFNISTVDGYLNPLETVYQQDQAALTVTCTSSYCNAEEVYFSTSVAEGRYMVMLTLLNMQQVKDNFSGIYMEMLEMNSAATLVLMFLKSFLLFFSLIFFFLFLRDKCSSPPPPSNPHLLIFGIFLLLLNLPTIIFAFAFHPLVADVVFTTATVSLFVSFLHFWTSLFENCLPIYKPIFRKYFWLKVLFFATIWIGLFSSFTYMIYQLQHNPVLPLESK